MNTLKRIKRKLKNEAAFTLAETLISVLILLMVSTIVAAGVPAAQTAYRGVVRAANAELLMSTTISTLRNELGNSNNVVIEDETTLSFINGSTGTGSKIYIGPATDGTSVDTIMYQQSAMPADLMLSEDEMEEYIENVGDDIEPVRLVSKEASTGNLYTTYDEVKYDDVNGVVTFEGLSVRDPGEDDPVTNRDIKIRVLSYK